MNQIRKQNIEQSSLSAFLSGLNPKISFLIGIFGSAFIGYYVPLFLITLTGVWRFMLLDLFNFLVCYTVLLLQNLIGNKIGKIIATGASAAAIFLIVEIINNLISNPHAPLSAYWSDLVFPVAACLLNAVCLFKFKKVANLT